MVPFCFPLHVLGAINRLLALLVVLIMAGCGSGNTSGGGELQVIDLEAAIDNPKALDLTAISESIDFIPLDDSSDEALIGDIRAMEESRSRFYIASVDNGQGPRKIFNKEGKFVSSLGQIGRGPNEFLAIFGMTVDYEKDNIYLMGYMNRPTVVAFDVAGNIFARNDLSIGDMSFYNDHFIALKPYPYPHDFDPSRKINFLEVFSSDLGFIDSISVFDKGPNYITLERASFTVAVNVMSNNGENLLVKEARSDTVFYYRDDISLAPAYYLDMGAYSMPDEAFNDLGYTGNREHTVSGIMEGDKYVFVTTRKRYGEQRVSFNVFDRDDPLGGFSVTGPDGTPGLFVDGIEFTPSYIRDNRLVGYIQAFDIVDNAGSITRPDLKALAATLKEDSNPVIVVAKLKDS